MKMEKMYMPTLKEDPSEAELTSHKLLLRAGMIRKLVSGIYSYLPLGYRVIRKVEEVVREEMDRAGSQELLMSAIQPKELWEKTGRWENFGPEMFTLLDRNSRQFCLGPTHEEYFTDLIKDEIKSYKQLPLNLYQIQTKYRDEKRPRFGLMRGREFIMKDAYSFDVDKEAMLKAYDIMWKAYDEVFTRLKLKYRVVEGDSGTMGGNESHEFMATSEAGEGLMAYCDSCDYAATDEKATVVYNVAEKDEEEQEMEKVLTEDVTTIDGLEEFFNMDKSSFGKALVFSVKEEPVVVVVPGDRELNQTKLENYLGIPSHDIEMADDEMIFDITGADKGYTGPVGLKEGTKIVVDSRITKMKNLIVGGNETDIHLKGVNYGRDFQGEVVDDLLMIEKGDKCPKCDEVLKIERGIEIGNIFQLGKKYSEGIGAKFLDQNGREQYFEMGSYGIGITRTVAAIVEQYHDDNGIIWPLNVAPYQVIITVINSKNDDQRELSNELYNNLTSRGVEVLLDNRKERAGVKFNDRDLIGIPIRVVVGRDAAERGVEFSLREDGEKEDIDVDTLYGRIESEFEKYDMFIREDA